MSTDAPPPDAGATVPPVTAPTPVTTERHIVPFPTTPAIEIVDDGDDPATEDADRSARDEAEATASDMLGRAVHAVEELQELVDRQNAQPGNPQPAVMAPDGAALVSIAASLTRIGQSLADGAARAVEAARVRRSDDAPRELTQAGQLLLDAESGAYSSLELSTLALAQFVHRGVVALERNANANQQHLELAIESRRAAVARDARSERFMDDWTQAFAEYRAAAEQQHAALQAMVDGQSRRLDAMAARWDAEPGDGVLRLEHEPGAGEVPGS